MQATGIVRRIDDLGRVVIPKDIRHTLRIREGDPLELFISDGSVMLKPYSPMGELADFGQEYIDSLHDAFPYTVLLAGRDQIVAVAGASKKKYLNRLVSADVEDVMENRRIVAFECGGDAKHIRQVLLADEDDGKSEYTAAIVAPIVDAGDPVGAFILCSNEIGVSMGREELKALEVAASFFGKYLGMQ